MTPRQSTKPKLPPGLYWRPTVSTSRSVLPRRPAGPREHGDQPAERGQRFLDARRGAAATGAPMMPRRIGCGTKKRQPSPRALREYGSPGHRRGGEAARAPGPLLRGAAARRHRRGGDHAYVDRRQAPGRPTGRSTANSAGWPGRCALPASAAGSPPAGDPPLKEAAPREGFFEARAVGGGSTPASRRISRPRCDRLHVRVAEGGGAVP